MSVYIYLSNASLKNLADQQEILLYALDEYQQQANSKKIDDITIIGIKI